MVRKKSKPISYKRKRQGKTNYKKRLRLLLAKKPRLIIRTANKKIINQIADFKTIGDSILVGIDSSALKKYGWNFSCKNLPAAYLTGYLTGKKALQKNIKETILDLGFRPPVKGNKIYACLKGALDAGLNIPHSPESFPSEERISGKQIQDYASKIKDTSLYQKIFSKYLKNNLNPEDIVNQFQKTKKLIEQEK